MADTPSPTPNVSNTDRSRTDPVRRFHVESATLLVLACLFVVLSQYQGWFRSLDRLIYDTLIDSLQAPQHEDIVIVAIDDASLHEFGAWPWSRRLQGQLLERVARFNPRIVAVDIDYGSATPADASLLRGASKVSTLALPMRIEQLAPNAEPVEVLPFPALAQQAALLGHVGVDLDEDAIVRGTHLYLGVDAPRWPHLMVATAAELTGRLPVANCSEAAPRFGVVKCQRVQLPFAGPPGTYPNLSARQIINGDLSEALLSSALSGKVVMIGVTAAGEGDWVTSPISGDGRPMTAVEFNANLLSALIFNTLILTPPAWALALFGMLVVVTCSLVLPRLRAMPMLFTAVGMALIPILGSAISLRIGWTNLPLVNTSMAVLLIYPIWSWRRHEIAWQFIQRELERIDQQNQEWDSLAGHYLTDLRNDAQIDHLSLLLAGPLSYHNAEGGEPRLMCERSTPLTTAERQLLNAAQDEFFAPQTAHLDQPGEMLARQIRRLDLAADEVRQGRAMGLAGLGHMSNGALIVSAFGQIRFANAAAVRLLQLTERKQAPGVDAITLLERIQPPLGQTWTEIARGIVLNKRPAYFEANAPNGSPVFVAAEPLRAPELAFAPNWVVTLSDLSAIRAAEAQREEALAFLSHDIRSPLLSVLALIRSSGESSKLLDDIVQYTQKGLSASEQFLQLSRLQLRSSFESYDLELEQLMLNALEQVFFLARENGIVCLSTGLLDEANHPPDHEGTWIVGNGELLERAIVNLLTNAIKYSERGTCITIGLTATAKEAIISVADQGHGIPPAELDRIFDPYFRSSAPGLASRRGAGLGLRFVKTVIDRHRGKVSVTSELGLGSTFEIRLPYAPQVLSTTAIS